MPFLPRDPRRHTTRAAPVAAALFQVLAAPAFAQDETPLTLGHCAAIGAAPDRLACYDKLAGRAAAPSAAAAQTALPAAAVVPTRSLLAAKDAALPDPADPAPSTSLLGKYWELDPGDKRGIFNFVGYQPNYVLPLHVTSRINRAPASPTQATVLQPDYRRDEAKFQLSLRTKLAQDLVLPNADLWVGFTQQTFWQIWNGKDSKPFRNSDYEPEAMYVVPTGPTLRSLPFGWQWRYTMAGLAH